MAIWIKKHFTAADNWAGTDLMDRAERLTMRFPYEFMMVEEKGRGLEATIWVRLPLPELAGMFPGFTEGQIGDLKKRPIRLVVEEGEFERVFGGFPAH
jgi:hypothetical protein